MAAILAVFGDDSMGPLVRTSTLPRPVAEATQNRTRLESRAERLLSMTASKYRASINGFWCHNETWDGIVSINVESPDLPGGFSAETSHVLDLRPEVLPWNEVTVKRDPHRVTFKLDGDDGR